MQQQAQRRAGGTPAVPPAASRRVGEPEAEIEQHHRWPSLEDAPFASNHWPELPEEPQSVESLDDPDHLRRIAEEQRGSAWSE